MMHEEGSRGGGEFSKRQKEAFRKRYFDIKNRD